MIGKKICVLGAIMMMFVLSLMSVSAIGDSCPPGYCPIPGCIGSWCPCELCDTSAQCDDGVDNDNDGLIDFPNDPGCESSVDNDESNPLPPIQTHDADIWVNQPRLAQGGDVFGVVKKSPSLTTLLASDVTSSTNAEGHYFVLHLESIDKSYAYVTLSAFDNEGLAHELSTIQAGLLNSDLNQWIPKAVNVQRKGPANYMLKVDVRNIESVADHALIVEAEGSGSLFAGMDLGTNIPKLVLILAVLGGGAYLLFKKGGPLNKKKRR